MKVCFGKNETRHRSEGLTKRGGRKGQDMKKWTGMITNLTMLTQFGLSLVTPLFLCLALCWWLCDRFSVGTWIYLIGFFFGIGGGAVAVLNFFLMGMAVQKAVSETDEAGAKRRMQASYSQRNLMQMLWAILAIVLPCFQFAAGILPLLIPGTAIKLKGIKNSIKR